MLFVTLSKVNKLSYKRISKCYLLFHYTTIEQEASSSRNLTSHHKPLDPLSEDQVSSCVVVKITQNIQGKVALKSNQENYEEVMTYDQNRRGPSLLKQRCSEYLLIDKISISFEGSSQKVCHAHRHQGSERWCAILTIWKDGLQC